jgi:hypothetical protein
MVAKIRIGKSIRGALRYNEDKVTEGTANLILASGFAGDIEQMTFLNKLKRFEHLNELKPTVRTNCLHISLNFDASEKIDDAKMQQIAMVYMEKIGFGEQPYLVYRHSDSAHQHFHIVTSSIQKNGESIKLHNIGREVSEPARKAIEQEFGLLVAESKGYKGYAGIKPVEAEKVSYGRLPTKRAISNVLAGVIKSYHYTSLAELNAVLKGFNVVAERGNEDSEMFKRKGLLFSVLDSKGEKIGVPIKASSFYHKATLQEIEGRLEKNALKRKFYKPQVVKKVERVLSRYEKISRVTLRSELKKQGIDLMMRETEAGLLYAATFVDHPSKSVFKGSDLGKAYTAKAIGEKLARKDQLMTYLKPMPKSQYLAPIQKEAFLSPLAPTNFLDNLLGRQDSGEPLGVPKQKKKRKKGLSR